MVFYIHNAAYTQSEVIYMGIISLLSLALALAMDAFSVAVTDGMILDKIRIRDAVKVSLYFGTFQFLMPCIGALASSFAYSYIERFDHWIVFGLLTVLGLHMIKESSGEREIYQNPLNTRILLMMAIATSIDALAAGITLSAVRAPVFFSSCIIGCMAFALSFIGIFLGKRFGDLLGNKAEIAGGILLILIGVKTLIEHLLY